MIRPPIIPTWYCSVQRRERLQRLLTVTITTVAATDELLRGNKLVEGVKLKVFASDRRATCDRERQDEPPLE